MACLKIIIAIAVFKMRKTCTVKTFWKALEDFFIFKVGGGKNK